MHRWLSISEPKYDIMIGKIKKISGESGGPLNYILGGKQDKDQSVTVVDYNGFILSNRMIEEIERVPKTDKEKEIRNHLVWSYVQLIQPIFDNRAALADSRVKKPYESYTIGYSPEDLPLLTPELRKTICKEFLEGIGVYGCSEKFHRDAIYLACSHHDTNAPHEHIMTCRIDENGKANDIAFDYWRALKVARAISKKYQLHMRLDNKEITEENGYTLCEKEYIRDEKKANPFTRKEDIMKWAIGKVLRDAVTFDELENKLLQHGILVNIRYHKNTNDAYGVVFELIDKHLKGPEMKSLLRSGNQLGRQFTYQNICKRLSQNEQNSKLRSKFNTVPQLFPTAKDITVGAIKEIGNNSYAAPISVDGRRYAAINSNESIFISSEIQKGKKITDSSITWKSSSGTYKFDKQGKLHLIAPTKDVQTTHSQAVQEGESEYDKLIKGKKGIKM